MKYMLMMFGDGATMMENHDTQWVREMIQFMEGFIQELAATGELVSAEGLTDPTAAKTISLAGDGQVVVTDGPFAEAKESLAGFWIWDVKDEARAIELATKVLPWARRVELREVADAPPEV
ncbi:YciI family protein [Actinoplanes sp. NPDC049265]|uniref:YciI family protein n=1 Tax=Actinoplanes sp. NPDC049265 TaxID=3363902 RepID=UPI003724938A